MGEDTDLKEKVNIYKTEFKENINAHNDTIAPYFWIPLDLE